VFVDENAPIFRNVDMWLAQGWRWRQCRAFDATTYKRLQSMAGADDIRVVGYEYTTLGALMYVMLSPTGWARLERVYKDGTYR
jgi:hypothetical protein